MHRTAIIFISLELSGRGAIGFRIKRNSKVCHYFHGVLEVAGKGVAGFRIVRSAYGCHHFHVFGSGWERGRLAS